MRGKLPTGTITFLFTDIEGSTGLLRQLGEGYAKVLERHADIIREALANHEGVEVGTEGDAFFAVFPSAMDAIDAAVDAQRGLNEEPWPDGVRVRVRMGIHTGEGRLGGDNYAGMDVHRAARIAAAGHGGQVLLSATTHALVEAGLPPGVRLRDLGVHRLKDLDRPERLVQLDILGLESDFPPLRSLEAPISLPPELTSFVGREREVEEAATLVRSARLVTLTGPGGTGKTRLAIRTGGSLLSSFGDGVFFVDLSPLIDPALVGPTVARTLRLGEQPDQPIVDLLKAHLEPLELLLVLDNFEHLLPAAAIVADLLSVAPRLRLLVTSRAILNVPGEQEYPVSPLALPGMSEGADPETVRSSEAGTLFLDRARAARPEFSITPTNARAIAEICVRLDGLPLAIELAASRVRILEPEEILARLEQRLPVLAAGSSSAPARQRTLRETVEWSVGLLSPAEQALFARLAVFAGGCTLEGAEAVCNSSGELGIDTLDGLGSLVDHSLVRHMAEEGESRYRMLETIRDYGRGRMNAESILAEIERRHALFYRDLVAKAEPGVSSLDQARWLDRLEREHDNVRAALSWCLTSPDVETGLLMASALWRFWQLRGYLREARSWLEALLASPVETTLATRARAYTALGGVTYWLSDAGATEAAYERALDLFRRANDRGGVAEGLYNLAFVPVLRGDNVEAGRRFETSLAAAREIGHQSLIARNHGSLGLVLGIAGDPAGLTLLEEALRFFRASGDRLSTSWAVGEMGSVHMILGQYGPARERMVEALQLNADSRSLAGIGAILHSLAALESVLGHHRDAVRLLGGATALHSSTGAAAPLMLTRAGKVEEIARNQLGDETVEQALEEGGRMTLDQAVAYALSLTD